MFNRRTTAQKHFDIEQIGGGMPKSPRMRQVVQRAIDHFDIADRVENAPTKVSREQGNTYLVAHEAVQERVERLSAQRVAETKIAKYLREVILPECDDPYLAKLIETMDHCHAGGNYGWHPEAEKAIIQWDAKCQCLQLCPHEANEETQRMTERYVPRLMELHEDGYTFQKAVLTQRCVERHAPFKDPPRRVLLEEIHQDRRKLLEPWQQNAANAFSFGRPMPLAPDLPDLDPIKKMRNRLHREQQRYFRRFDRLIKMRWPRAYEERLKLLDLEPDQVTEEQETEIRKRKGRVFDQIAACLVIMETPLNYEGHWHPHLNVLFVLKENYFDWVFFMRLWGGICKFTTEQDMWDITTRRMEAAGEDVDALTFEDVLKTALQEIIKYPVQTVAEKAAGNVGYWSGGDRGHGLFLTDDGQHIAPPLTDWPVDAFLEWWYAQYAFRRSRSYGGGILYAWEKEEPETLSMDQVVQLGRIEAYAGGQYRVSLPLLQFIEGHNSPVSGVHTKNTTGSSKRGPPDDRDILKMPHDVLVMEIRLERYIRDSWISGWEPERGIFL